jgi:two-component system, LytTR family, response regulator LytT
MKLIIVEDEKLAAERLRTLVKEYDPSIEVIACLESVEETVQYLRQHAAPDLLLLDIHLSDGHSFEIFSQVNYTGPVIFTTAFDQYALDAFKIFSIDYILKPVTLEALANALNKFRNLSAGFAAADYRQLMPQLITREYKKRFLGKVGQRLFFVETADIAYFQADNKVVYLIDREGNRYVVEHTMEKLMVMINPAEFFRLNRRYIVRINAIQQVKPYFNGRLKLSVRGSQQPDEMVISRERVAEFKEWAEA